jgi:hypothetical protein
MRPGKAQREGKDEPRDEGNACEKHASGANGASSGEFACSDGHVRFLPGRAGWGNVVLSKCKGA